jgi:1,2-diacylglycerol 3-alpha-glucosyltransferase
MKIALVTDCYLPTKNGVATSVAQLKEGLAAQGHTPIVITVKTPADPLEEDGVYRFSSLPFNPLIELRFGVVNPLTMRDLFKTHDIDIVHIHTEFNLGWTAKWIAQLLNIPIIHTSHTMFEDYRHYLPLGHYLPRTIIKRILKLFLSHVNTLVCPSQKSHTYFNSFLPDIKKRIIGNGICNHRFMPGILSERQKIKLRDSFGICRSDKVILNVGRIAPEKRVHELLTVLIPLLHQSPTYKLLFVGNGSLFKKMRRVAQKNKVSDQIIFAGYREWEQMPRIYNISDIFVTASLSEVHPMTLMEALMCGLPVIARKDQSNTGIVLNKKTGYLVNTDNQIPQKIKKILDNPDLLSQFSKNATLHAKSFSKQVHVENCIELYEEILNPQNKPR